MVAMAIFSKVLQISDVEKRLSIPEACVKAFQPTHKGTEMSLQVRDESGVVWTFPFGFFPTEGYSKPAVYGDDWLRFARSKKLGQGGKITLYKKKDHGAGADYEIAFKKRASYYLKDSTKDLCAISSSNCTHL